MFEKSEENHCFWTCSHIGVTLKKFCAYIIFWISDLIVGYEAFRNDHMGFCMKDPLWL